MSNFLAFSNLKSKLTISELVLVCVSFYMNDI